MDAKGDQLRSMGCPDEGIAVGVGETVLFMVGSAGFTKQESSQDSQTGRLSLRGQPETFRGGAGPSAQKRVKAALAARPAAFLQLVRWIDDDHAAAIQVDARIVRVQAQLRAQDLMDTGLSEVFVEAQHAGVAFMRYQIAKVPVAQRR